MADEKLKFCKCMQVTVVISDLNMNGECPGLNCQKDYCNKTHCDFWRETITMLMPRHSIPTNCLHCMNHVAPKSEKTR